jgi:hypothetical protein
MGVNFCFDHETIVVGDYQHERLARCDHIARSANSQLVHGARSGSKEVETAQFIVGGAGSVLQLDRTGGGLGKVGDDGSSRLMIEAHDLHFDFGDASPELGGGGAELSAIAAELSGFSAEGEASFGDA